MNPAVIGVLVWLIVQLVNRRKESREPINYSLIVVILLWPSVLGLAILWLGKLLEGDLTTLPKLLCALVLLFPWPTLQLVVMPLGLPRTAYLVSYLCLLRFRGDRRGAALLIAARTLLRAGSRSLAAPRFVDSRLAVQRQMRGASVVAMGLLKAYYGETAAARALLESAWNLHEDACPRWALAQAGEWLLVEAVAGGDWRQVSELAGRLEVDTALTGFLRACAARFVHTDASPLAIPGTLALYYRWLRAPYRSATRPLLLRAARSQPQPVAEKAPAAPAPADSQASDLPAALRALAELLQAPLSAVTQDLLLHVCRTWDTALQNPQTERQIIERALTLGHPGASALRGELRAQVAAALAARLRESGLPISRLRGDDASEPASEVGALAAASVRSELLEQIEQACQALHDRTLDKRALLITDEWTEWATLRALYQRVCSLGGLSLRRLAWATFHREACSWAVWLWNDRREKILGNAVFRFLLSEAEELNDDTRIPLDRKNVDCGI